jgi:hypothetical protein
MVIKKRGKPLRKGAGDDERKEDREKRTSRTGRGSLIRKAIKNNSECVRFSPQRRKP